jgi:tetratricopeptide (TPR) repeat protein
MARGEVFDEAGEPMAEVEVIFAHLGSNKKFETDTNARGRFTLVGLPPGGYQTRFMKDGYMPGIFDVRIPAGDFTDVPPVTLAELMPPPPETPPAAEAPAPVSVAEAFDEAGLAVREERLEDARRLYEQVLDVVDIPEAHYNLGIVLQRLEDWAGAEAHFSRTIELQPDKSEAYGALAEVYRATGRDGEARETLARAEELFGGDPRLQYNLGVEALNEGRTEDAERALRRALDLDPQRIEAHYHLAMIDVGKQQVAEAIQRLETYLAGEGQNEQNLASARQVLDALRAEQP